MSQKVAKELCVVCGFVVNPVGHEVRCAVRTPEVAEYAHKMRRAAWAGDADHQIDVRAFILSLDLQDVELQGVAQKFVAADAQLEWAKYLEDFQIFMPRGDSSRLLVEAFEANYRDVYRAVYKQRALPFGAGGGFEDSYRFGDAVGPRDTPVASVLTCDPREGWSGEVLEAYVCLVADVEAFESKHAAYRVCVTRAAYGKLKELVTLSGVDQDSSAMLGTLQALRKAMAYVPGVGLTGAYVSTPGAVAFELRRV